MSHQVLYPRHGTGDAGFVDGGHVSCDKCM